MPLLQLLLTLLPSVPCLVSGLNIPTHATNLTAPLVLNLPSLPLPLHPLPNPYPIPNTDITLDFAPHGEALAPQLVVALFTTVVANVTSQHRTNDHFPARRVFRQGGVEVVVESYVGVHYSAHELSYGDVVMAVRGIGLKMLREGVWAWRVGVWSTEGGEEIGGVFVARG